MDLAKTQLWGPGVPKWQVLDTLAQDDPLFGIPIAPFDSSSGVLVLRQSHITPRFYSIHKGLCRVSRCQERRSLSSPFPISGHSDTTLPFTLLFGCMPGELPSSGLPGWTPYEHMGEIRPSLVEYLG
jgi:hypothetical protein